MSLLSHHNLKSTLSVFFFFLTIFTSCKGQKKISKQPNILFIAVDDLRPNLGVYGDTTAVTPNMDKLAKKGTVFSRAYAQQAVCSPSRTSLMTGLRPDMTQVWDLRTHFREHLPDAVTLPQYFKQQGYHTQMVGKIYHDSRALQDSLSWSVPETLEVTGEVGGKYALKSNIHDKGSWKAVATESADVPDTAYIDGRVAKEAIKILDRIKDKTFFLAVGFRRPHLPFTAPKKYWERYDKKNIPPPSFPHPPKNVPKLAMHEWKELQGYTDIPLVGKLTKEKIRRLRHGYYASTTFVDAQIGKILHELDRLGLAQDTIIVLWGDHGYHLGEHNLWGKTTNFELDARVPLIVADPSQSKKGWKTNALVELVDLYPTLASMCDLPVPDHLGGSDISSLLDNPEQSIKKAAFSQFPRPWFYKGKPRVMGYTVRTDHYRYTEWQNFKTDEIYARELYNHMNDSLETVNLADQKKYDQKIEALHKLLLYKF